MVTYEDLLALSLTHDDVSESPYYGGISVMRGKRWMYSLKKDGETVALKLDWPTHDRLLEAHPEALYKTAHYEGYPAFLVRLESLTPEVAKEIVAASWADAPKPAKKIRPS